MGCLDGFPLTRKRSQTLTGQTPEAAASEHRTHRSTVSEGNSSSSSQPATSNTPLPDPTGVPGDDTGIDAKGFAHPQVVTDKIDRKTKELSITDMQSSGNVQIGYSPDTTPAKPATTPLDEGYPVEGGVDPLAASARIADVINRLPQNVKETEVLEEGMVRTPILLDSSTSPAKAPLPAELGTDITDEKVRKFLCAITVGIGGCSSSGKSTLAFLLAEIFNPTQTPTSPAHVASTFLTQDDFFKPKDGLPNCTFYEHLSSQYIVSSAHSKLPGLYNFSTTFDPDTSEQRWEVTGPNTDCPEAIDFFAFQEAIKDLATEGKTNKEEKEKQAVKIGKGGPKVNRFDTSAADMRAKYADLIRVNREFVTKCLGKHLGDFKFVFVEGFLLFNDPKVSPQTPTDWQRVAIHHRLDVRIFLPTSRQTAKERRLSRKPYLDPPKGGRQPGQMFKAEGYFDGVVWPEYEKEYGWILKSLKDGKLPQGQNIPDVCVRDGGEDVSVAETVAWAARCVLYQTLQLAKKGQLKTIDE